MYKMNYIPKVDMTLSEYGLGAWAIGGEHYGEIAEKQAKEVIRGYFESGGNFIDTARGYGESERLIGEVLEEMGIKNDVIIATKSLGGDTMDRMDKLRSDLEESLKQLKRDYIDIFFIHFPSDDSEVMNRSLEICEEFKKEGLIKAIGASIKGPNVDQSTLDMAEAYIKDGRVDVLLMVYSIFRQLNAPIFEMAKEHGVGVIIRTVLESGFLSGGLKKGVRFSEQDHRNRWNNKIDDILEDVDKIGELAKTCGYQGVNEVAIRFAMQGAHNTSVIIGAENKMQLDMTIAAMERPPLSDEVMDYIKTKYKDSTSEFNSEAGNKSFGK